jgi:hypothetical protein
VKTSGEGVVIPETWRELGIFAAVDNDEILDHWGDHEAYLYVYAGDTLDDCWAGTAPA